MRVKDIIDEINQANPEKINAKILELLEGADKKERNRIAQALRDEGFFDEKSPKAFESLLFTDFWTTALIRPLMIRFALEVCASGDYIPPDSKRWIKTIMVIVGELALNNLGSNNKINNRISLPGLARKYYKSNELGPIPNKLLTRFKECVNGIYEEEPDETLTDGELIYSCVLENFKAKLELFGNKNSDFEEELYNKTFKILEANVRYSDFFEKGQYNFIALDTLWSFIDVYLYVGLALAFKADDDFYFGGYYFDSFEEAMGIQEYCKSQFENLRTRPKFLTDLADKFLPFFKQQLEEIQNRYAYQLEAVERVWYIDPILEGIISSLEPNSVQLDYCKVLRHYFDSIMENTNAFNKGFRSADSADFMESLGLAANANELITTVQESVIESLKYLKVQALEWSDDAEEVFGELLKCTLALTKFYIVIWDNAIDELKPLWEEMNLFFNEMLKRYDPVPKNLLFASFYSDLALWYILQEQYPMYFSDYEDPEMIGFLEERSRKAVKIFEKLAVEENSNKALQLVIWYCGLSVDYYTEVKEENEKAQHFVELQNRFYDIGKERGFESSTKNTDIFKNKWSS